MWYGLANQASLDEAEFVSNKRKHEELQAKLAGYAAAAAIARAKAKFEAEQQIKRERMLMRPLKADTIRKRIARGDM